MKSPEEMQTLFADLPDALERTLEIADNVQRRASSSGKPICRIFRSRLATHLATTI